VGTEHSNASACPCFGVARDLAVVVSGADAEVMEAVAEALDPLAPHRQALVLERDQLDEHVAGERHGQRHLGLRRRAAI
jgi:hypothetical protein